MSLGLSDYYSEERKQVCITSRLEPSQLDMLPYFKLIVTVFTQAMFLYSQSIPGPQPHPLWISIQNKYQASLWSYSIIVCSCSTKQHCHTPTSCQIMAKWWGIIRFSITIATISRKFLTSVNTCTRWCATLPTLTSYVQAQGYVPWWLITYLRMQLIIEHVAIYTLPQSDNTVHVSCLFWMDKVVKLSNKFCTAST